MERVCPTIMAVVLNNRVNCAPKVQEILTANGCMIQTRLGVHEACEDRGLILLHLCGPDTQVDALERDLIAVPGVRVKRMKIDL